MGENDFGLISENPRWQTQKPNFLRRNIPTMLFGAEGELIGFNFTFSVYTI